MCFEVQTQLSSTLCYTSVLKQHYSYELHRLMQALIQGEVELFFLCVVLLERIFNIT